ncbi:acyl-CoA dehydrogenase family protein [Dactylosporangium sucinum]|uniref:Acyl-CoA dehydrogenase/oxidase C-terminal domain-containing protein n=1 Tax=Dactylosporangium sucinum TaxID=1424081 RepID=A0A917U9V2_9ACTN|nr:acyl-CoA dehydrogenase family protein [Dactylosporangium sucinum]GGM64760.1 hypothetical protein GCM10007977_077770 [Dactylosporangium sucinum]
MDFDLTPAQAALLESVKATVAGTGGLLRAQDLSRDGKYDAQLDEALQERVDLSAAELLERAIVAEYLAEVGTATTFGLRAVLGAEVALPPGPVAVADWGRPGPVRFATVASSLVLLDGDDAFLTRVEPERIAPVRSSYGYPYGRVDLDGTARTERIGDGGRLRSLWRLANAAEIAGNAATAVARTAEHLRTRKQFGKPLAFFQALRHRLADAAVTAEATRWTVREAAFTGESRDLDLAASYAADGAAKLVPELVQMCGARSFTIGFELQAHAVRLSGLRLELGGDDRLAAAVLAHNGRDSRA